MGMFGLGEDKKKKEGGVFTFDLENDLQDETKYQELIKRVENRVQKIRDMLRQGADKKDYEELAILLKGYSGLLKVMAKARKKK